MTSIVILDADVSSADWTKTSWDLPPYKSAEFFSVVKDLEKFRASPAYASAVAAGLIHDDEWVDDCCHPAGGMTKEWTASSDATSGITAYGSTKERRKKRRVRLTPTEGKDHGN